MSKSKKSRERIVRNFVITYGFDRFIQFVQDVSVGRSGQEIANEFNVSRERVRQWKNAFGSLHTEYRLDPVVVAEAKEIRRKLR